MTVWRYTGLYILGPSGVGVAVTRALFNLLLDITLGWLFCTCHPLTGVSNSLLIDPSLAELSTFSRMSMWWDLTGPHPTIQLRTLRLSSAVGTSPAPEMRAAEDSSRSVGAVVRVMWWGGSYRCSERRRSSRDPSLPDRLSVSVFSVTYTTVMESWGLHTISSTEATGWATWLRLGSVTVTANISSPTERMYVPLSLAVGTPLSSCVALSYDSQAGRPSFPVSVTWERKYRKHIKNFSANDGLDDDAMHYRVASSEEQWG